MKQRHSKNAQAWAEKFFDCRVHQEEAAQLFDALAKLSSAAVDGLHPDMTLGEWLAEEGHAVLEGSRPCRSAVTVAGLLQEALQELLVKRQFLGAAASTCTWEPGTLSARSLRGIINERVRRRGGCSCDSDEAG